MNCPTGVPHINENRYIRVDAAFRREYRTGLATQLFAKVIFLTNRVLLCETLRECDLFFDDSKVHWLYYWK
ncbi:hypothetical protein GTQ43_24955 [Nostoc sp. KVJ3]|uniref:hypothetical protein n=1 Tax=Nostoc sp. KVJ3 TaxID=457945 RepID=UPI002238805E|nr:hypothetical protein [Nostoc sp. KVJ3]MCW5316945.1 hypothetical protein [Nostoc sp. KVJ3]